MCYPEVMFTAFVAPAGKIYRVIKNWCESFEDSSYVLCLLHPSKFFLYGCTRVLVN